ncbi:HAMP domain-containing protein [Nitrosopumilus sp. K4]|uniref:sensor histidine kinase n=1 Tax=Nitrosopumilus sp. K4 TaxID=2795383 RepID=UPI001BA97DDC|nr:ATP-binding protein [Nitrosopumilus sp. K4]QUC64027.1 HAMP domain-containing protein [Nitrosopumilus sp. K4]
MKIGIKLIILFLIVALIPILTLSVIHYQNTEKQIIDQTFQRLNTSAILIESQIQSEIENHLLALDMFSTRVLLRTSLESHNNFENQKDADIMNLIIDDALLPNSNLDAIYITNNENKIVSSTERAVIGKNLIDVTLSEESIDSKKIHLILKHREYHKGPTVHVQLLSQLFSESGEKIGGVVMEFDASDVLLGNKNTGLGKTGEYVLAKKDRNGDALFITPLRFEPDAALKKTMSKDRTDMPIVQALLKNEQTFDNAIDYREKPVFAITRYFEDVDWGLVVKIDRDEALLPIENLRNITYFAIAITVIFAIIASVLFSKPISDSILRIRNAARSISKGNFSEELPSTGSDEIKDLSKDINEMAKELDNQRKSLIKSERMSAIGQTAARIAHDIKNPLTALNLSIELFMKKHKDEFDEKDQKQLKIITQSLFRINRQVNDVLDFVRNKPLTVTENKLNDLIKNSVNIIQKPEGITIDIPRNDFTIKCDSVKMESVFMNLLTNAIQSIGNKGKITINSFEKNNNIVLEFIDSGPGIPEDIMPHIFDPLFTTKFEGTGLGLVSCKNIIEQHKGTISIKNNPTTVTIQIPKS